MASIVVTLDMSKARSALGRLSDTVSPDRILRVIGMRFQSYVAESFKTRGRGSWAPLAWSTVALRRRGGSVPLQDTGRYRQSFVTETDKQTFVEVGTNLKTETGIVLAKIHEYGTGPYTIRARNARVLAARIGAGAGGAGEHGPLGMVGSQRSSNWLFFGKEVHHPGIPARPVLPDQRTAEKLAAETVEAMLQAEVSRGGG